LTTGAIEWMEIPPGGILDLRRWEACPGKSSRLAVERGLIVVEPPRILRPAPARGDDARRPARRNDDPRHLGAGLSTT
jgi:hypothetical protein